MHRPTFVNAIPLFMVVAFGVYGFDDGGAMAASGLPLGDLGRRVLFAQIDIAATGPRRL